MKLKKLFKEAFDKYPTLYGNRQQVLIHIFCMFGTNYRWKDGELVSSELGRKNSKFELDENGKAIETKNINEVALRFLYDSIVNNRVTDEKVAPYEMFEKRIHELFEEDGKSIEETVLKDTLAFITSLRNESSNNLARIMCREYSPIFNIPKDIKPDWEDGLKEVYEIMRELNVDLDSIPD